MRPERGAARKSPRTGMHGLLGNAAVAATLARPLFCYLLGCAKYVLGTAASRIKEPLAVAVSHNWERLTKTLPCRDRTTSYTEPFRTSAIGQERTDTPGERQRGNPRILTSNIRVRLGSRGRKLSR